MVPVQRRNPTDWARLVPTAMTTLAASSKVLLATFTLSNPGIGETIRRTRGMIWVASDQATVLEDQIGAVGMMIVTDRAVAVGITAIPDPVTEATDDGWFVWVPILQQGDTGPNHISGFQYPFDSKAMRKVPEGFSIVVVAANSHGADGFDVGINLSMLSSRS